MSNKRDNAYYLARLKRKDPDVFRDFKGGLFPNLMEALIKAGIRKPPAALPALKSIWTKASNSDRRAFIIWERSLAVLPGPFSGKIVDANSRLLPAAEVEIRRLMKIRGIGGGGRLAKVLGFNVYNSSIFLGLRLKPELVKALTKWVNGGGA